MVKAIRIHQQGGLETFVPPAGVDAEASRKAVVNLYRAGFDALAKDFSGS